MGIISGILNEFTTSLVIEVCRSTGHVCSNWINYELYETYQKNDVENGTSIAEEYLKRCHDPVFIAKPPFGDEKEWSFHLKCHGPLTKCEYCSYSNEEAKLILASMFKKFFDQMSSDK